MFNRKPTYNANADPNSPFFIPEDRRPVYTKNPFVLWYAETLYWVSYKIQSFMEKHTNEKPEWLFGWLYSAEARYNCTIEPLLGKKVRSENKSERASRKYMDARDRGVSGRKLERLSQRSGKLFREHRILTDPEQVAREDALLAQYTTDLTN